MANYTLGRGEELFVAAESTFGTMPGSTSADSFAAGDAVAFLEADASIKIEKEARNDKDNSRTAKEQIVKRRTGSFSIKGFLLGAGAASSAPDADLIFKSAFGSSAVGTSEYNYRPATDPTDSFSFMLVDTDKKNHSKIAVGCVVETLKVMMENGLAVFQADGSCADVYHTSRVACNVGAASGDTSITVDDASGLEIGSLLAVSTISGEQLSVTAVNTSTNVITVTRGWGATSAAVIASGSSLIPWHPSSKTLASTSPIADTKGSLTIGGVAVSTTGCEFTITNNKEFINDHYGTAKISDYVNPNKRDVMLNVNARLERAMIKYLVGSGKNEETFAVIWTIGDTAGSRFEINLPTARLWNGLPDIKYPEKETVKVSMDWKAFNSSDNGEVEFDQT